MTPRSSLTRQANVTSSWEFCYSYTVLGGVLRNPQHNISSAIPWIVCKKRIQYLLDRVDGRQQGGEEVMELTLQEWARLLVPEAFPHY
jgi:hypothetical protein